MLALLGLGALGAIVGAAGFFILSTRWLMLIQAGLTLFIVGLADYYLRLPVAYWAGYAFCGLIFAKWALMRRDPRAPRLFSQRTPAFLVCMMLFLGHVAVSTLFNLPPAGVVLVGIKMYYPYWLLLPAIFFLMRHGDYYKIAFRFLLFLPFVELPFVLHQRFVIAPQKSEVSWDAVVGTFGGDPMGGGASGTLMLFMAIAILVGVNALQNREENRVFVGASIAAALACIFLGEVKAVFLILPAAFAVQQIHRLKRRPFTSLILGSLLGVALLGTYQYYDRNYWSTYQEGMEIQGDVVGQTIAYVFGTDNISLETGEVGRGASLYLWYLDEEASGFTRLLGYGAASARVTSSVAIGAVGERFKPVDVGSTAISQLLWDTGLIGTFLFTLSLILALLQAIRLAGRAKSRIKSGHLDVIAAICMMNLMTLFYNRSIIDRPVEQFLLVLVFGVLAYESYRAARARPVRMMPKKLRGAPRQAVPDPWNGDRVPQRAG